MNEGDLICIYIAVNPFIPYIIKSQNDIKLDNITKLVRFWGL